MQSSSKATPIIVGSLAVIAIVGVGGYIYASGATNDQTSNNAGTEPSVVQASDTTTQSNTTQTTTPTSEISDTSSSVYANGTYTATTSYAVPRGFQNTIKVTVTVDNGTISAVSATHEYEDRESEFYVDAFDADISAAVGGDTIDDAYAGRVGGASLTSNAFNDALQTIVNDAKV